MPMTLDTFVSRAREALTAMPEADFAWSLTANWGGFGGLLTKKWDERERSTEEMFGELYGRVSQVPGLRVYPRLDPPLPTPGQFDVELIHDFLLALVNPAGMNLHVRMLSGRNPHHVVEAAFKGLARALDAATQREARLAGVLSTKGTLAG